MPLKPPEERRLSNLRWSVAGIWLVAVTAMMFFEALSTIGGRGGPEHLGLREADRIVPPLFLGYAAAWLVTLFPVLPIETRLRGMRRCRVAIFVTAAGWLLWTLSRGCSFLR